jgi:hypothetical protein
MTIDGLVSRTRAEGCLFLRKMKRSLDISVWERIVIQRRRGRDSGIAGRTLERESSREVKTPQHSMVIHDERKRHDSRRHDRRKRDWGDDSNRNDHQNRQYWKGR